MTAHALEPSEPAEGAPIFVVGVCRRSGTNFLARALGTHPDCVRPRDPLREDHLFRDGRRLVRYSHAVARRWPRRWGDREAARRVLLTNIGRGLAGFLEEMSGPGRVVTKTPSTRNLDLAATLVPGAHLVVLVRDGRSATESLVQGFGFTRERAMWNWRRGAQRILDLLDGPAGANPRVTLVRFEDLVADPETELARVLRAVGLDPSRLEDDVVRRLPVTGSSFLRSASDQITWEPQQRPAGFDPAHRHADWSRVQRERFAWVAGPQQRRLGYVVDASGGRVWTALNTVMDLAVPLVLAFDLGRVSRRRVRWWREGRGQRTQSASP